MFLETKREGEAKTVESWRQLLLDAADYIEAHGWVKNRIGTTGAAVCAVGAIWMAFQGDIPTHGRWGTGRVIDVAFDRLTQHVKELGFRGPSYFNDASTKSKVLAEMRACANS